jgi:RES domain
MNAQGIAVFYGATDPLVALADVRPPVGSTVAVGRFELIRPVRLLDVEAFLIKVSAMTPSPTQRFIPAGPL